MEYTLSSPFKQQEDGLQLYEYRLIILPFFFWWLISHHQLKTAKHLVFSPFHMWDWNPSSRINVIYVHFYQTTDTLQLDVGSCWGEFDGRLTSMTWERDMKRLVQKQPWHLCGLLKLYLLVLDCWFDKSSSLTTLPWVFGYCNKHFFLTSTVFWGFVSQTLNCLIIFS